MGTEQEKNRQLIHIRSLSTVCKYFKMVGTNNILEGSKLAYFPLTGRAETARVALHIAGLKWDDERLDYPALMALKEQGEWLGKQFPILTLSDGRILGNAIDIQRFVARNTGLYSEDSFEAGQIDNYLTAIQDVFDAVAGSFGDLSEEQQIEARKEAVLPGGVFYKKLQKIEAFLNVTAKDSKFAVGNRLTIADIKLAIDLGANGSGFWKGIDAKVWFKDFPKAKALYQNVYAHEKVQEWFALEKNVDNFHRCFLPTLLDEN